MSMNVLHDELESLVKLKADLMATAKTDAEKARLTPQLVALSKQVSQLAKDCERHDVRYGRLFETDKVMALVKDLVEIIVDELSQLPDYGSLPQRLVNLARVPEAADWAHEIITEFPDRVQIIDNIVARIQVLMASLSDGEPPADTN